MNLADALQLSDFVFHPVNGVMIYKYLDDDCFLVYSRSNDGQKSRNVHFVLENNPTNGWIPLAPINFEKSENDSSK